MRISNAKAPAAIVAREAFDNSGSTLGGRSTFIGWSKVPADSQLPSSTVGDVAYWVYSYDTPIAWMYEDGSWFMPPVRYSLTTTMHQNLTARAIGYDFKAEVSLMAGHGHKGAYGPRSGW